MQDERERMKVGDRRILRFTQLVMAVVPAVVLAIAIGSALGLLAFVATGGIV